MGDITTDLDEMTARITDAFERFVRLVADVPPDTQAYASEWTSRQVSAHVLSVLHRYTDRDLRSWDGLSATWEDLHLQNANQLADFERLPVPELVAALRAEFGRLAALSDMLDAAEVMKFHFGETITGLGGLGNMLGELLVHGYDIARGAGVPWPIADRDAQLVLHGIVQIADSALNRAALAGKDLCVVWRADDMHVKLVVEQGKGGFGFVDPTDPPRRPDVVIAGPASTMMLALYGRLGPFAAARRGVLVRGGRRPWLAFSLEKLFLR